MELQRAGRPRREPAGVDHDLGGAVGVRIIGGAPRDHAAVARQLGRPAARPLERQRDIQVRFVSRIPMSSWHSIDGRGSGFTDDGYFVAAGKTGRRARIPFDSLEGPCEILCESGASTVPLLVDAVKLCALRNGFLPLHASAFADQGTGVLVIGWPHTGKTAALLAFTQQRAALVADDVVFVSGDGRQMAGLLAPIGIPDWQLRQLPHLWRHSGPARRLASRGLDGIERLATALAAVATGTSAPRRLVDAALPAFRRRLRVELPPEVVCPGQPSPRVEPRKLFLMLTHALPDIRVEPAEPGEMLHRMIQLARHDRMPLFGHYLGYRFAFPDRPNRFLEQVHELEEERLRALLAALDCWIVRHPRPLSLRMLHQAMSPACHSGSMTREAVST
jgi:hypothetical protein